MATNTGRTVDKFVRVIVADSTDILREIPVDSIGDIGLNHESMDLTAWQDAVKNMLSGRPSAPIKIGGPFDSSVAVAIAASGAAPALSGSHTVLSGICGDNKPHTAEIRFGVRHYWETGEPTFGLQRATASGSGYTCVSYTVSGGKYSAELVPMGGIAPTWETTARTAGT